MAWSPPERVTIGDAGPPSVAYMNANIRDLQLLMAPEKVTTLGDVVAATAVGEVDREPKGNQGDLLTADSASARGVSAQPSGERVERALWIPFNRAEDGAVTRDNTYGAANVGTNATDGEIYFQFQIPEDVTSIDSAVLIWGGIDPGANYFIGIFSNWGQVGSELSSSNSDSIPTTGYSTPGNQVLDFLDISAALTGLAGGDQGFVRVLRNGANPSDSGTASVPFWGILIEATAG